MPGFESAGIGSRYRNSDDKRSVSRVVSQRPPPSGGGCLFALAWCFLAGGVASIRRSKSSNPMPLGSSTGWSSGFSGRFGGGL